MSGLLHAVVKQAENFRGRELAKKIDSHPHRQALQADLQQSIAFNPFSEKSKEIITDFQDPLVHFTPSSDQDMDDVTLGKLLAELHRDYADYRCPEGVSVSPSSMSVVVDRTGEPVERSDSDHFGFSVRNVKSAQNQFPVFTQTERMVDRTGKLVEDIIGIAEERESSSAKIRTLMNIDERLSQSHHELQAARAEQERKILQEEL